MADVALARHPDAGHCHPKVTAAAQDQLGNLVHAQINIGHSDAYIRFLKALLPKLALAHPSLDSVFLWNSGAEAVEAAVKLARASTGKQNVIVMQGERIDAVRGRMRRKI